MSADPAVRADDSLHRLEMAYIGVEVRDPAALGHFYTNVLGLTPTDPPSGEQAAWRIDAAPFRLLAAEGPADDAVLLGVEAADDATYDEVVAAVSGLGIPVTSASPEHRAARQVRRLAAFRAPWGLQVELVAGFARLADGFGPAEVPGGFLTDQVGFGHAVFEVGADSFEPSRAFLEDGLGLRRSDSLEMTVDGMKMSGIFYHCNPRHHSVALAAAPAGQPRRHLHHIMLETVEVDGVGAAYERVLAARVPVAAGLGRHDNDEMFSFYAVSPAGYQVEIGWGARTISSPWTEDRVYDRPSRWGHAAHEEG